LEQDAIELAKKANLTLALTDDLHFMCSRADFKRWAAHNKTLRMEFFYREMRRKYQVLMHGSKPEGDKWNYDADNRKAFGKNGPVGLHQPPKLTQDAITQEVIALVEQHFPEHPGSLENFIWPVTRDDALKFLHDFVKHRLGGFGEHQDAMWQTADGNATPYLWHSLLSTSLNLKLLNPREVIEAAQEAYKKQHLSLSTVEGFIRQILGWREFIRGMYWLDMPAIATANHYHHQRKLPAWYWTGETHMNCQRQAVSQTMQHGYAHHIQRLMVTGMFGILAEINPVEL
jgi:deoxyribodipyrimidine photolyase-related protein